MSLDKFLLKEKDTICKKWFDRVVDTYPPETAKMLRRESSQFANPVGHTFHDALLGLFDEFISGKDPEKIHSFLDKIIRIRAIQDFTPSQAVAFIFLLKKIAREALHSNEEAEPVSDAELEAFDWKVDELALFAFNVYMECREKLSEVRLTEFKNRTYRLLQRANLVGDYEEIVKKQESGPDSGDAN